MNKDLKKFLIASLAVGVINFSPIVFYENNLQIISVVHAEIRTYEAVGRAEFNFGENNPQLVEMAKNYARMNAVQVAKEKAGIYLKSFSRSLGGNVTDDDISVVASNSTEIIDVKFKQMPYVSHDVHGNATGEIGIAYEATATVKIDSNELSRYIKCDQQEKLTLIEQNKSSQKKIADINNQIEELKNNPQKATPTEIQNIDNNILAKQKFDEGLKLYYKKDYRGAITKYNEAIELNPNYAEAYNERGICYRNLKNYDSAIKNYSNAIRIDNNYSDAYLNRGHIYSNLKNYEQAIKDYSNAIQINNKFERAYSSRGHLYRELKNYDKAIEDFSTCIKLNPSIGNYETRAFIYEDVGNYAKAIEDWTKAIEIKKTNPNYGSRIEDLYLSRDIAYSTMKTIEKSAQFIKDYEKKIEKDPSNSSNYTGLGNIYCDLKSYDKAIENYEKAIQCNPNDKNAYSRIAIIYRYNLKNYDKAIQVFSKYIKIAPNCYNYKHRGDFFRDLKIYDKAIADYTKCIEFAPNYFEVYSDRGDSYAGLKNYDKALADYNKAIELEPDYSSYYMRRGDIYLKMSEYDKALADYNKAIELRPNSWNYLKRGDFYKNLKNYINAIDDYTKCIELKPEDLIQYCRAHFQRGLCYQALGNNEQAEKDFAKARQLGYNG